MPKLRACDAAIEVLRETDNPAVMWGDEGLLHLIAERLGWPHNGPRTSDRVMAALNRTPGDLVKRQTQTGRGRWVSVFRLPETIEPERAT
jgi:hypothetical protein